MSVTPVSATLSVENVIIVKGTANPDCTRFSINLCSGSDYSEDTALHFNPRFPEAEVVRNSFRGDWGDEEKDGGFPFTQGAPYDVQVVVKEGHFEISVNGSHFCNFNHRLPFESVRNVYVEGDTTAYVGISQSLYPVPFPVSEGVEIVVYGAARSSAGRFSINLSSGTNFNSDTPLHFNPRFDANEVVRNHYSGGWGEEEKDGGFPFSEGAPYEVKIAVRGTHYQVFVNGSHFCNFYHRLDTGLVRNVFIEGDSDVSNVLFTEKRPIFNPPVPVCVPIPGGVVPGVKVEITGSPKSNPERFNVNMVCGPDFDSSDLALHYDARINYGENQNCTVRTHRSGGDYGDEEREEPFFPFAPLATFNMRIAVEPDGFQVYVNEQYHSTFAHRIQPVQNITHLAINGDVDITQIRFE